MQLIERELKRYFILCAIKNKNKGLGMYSKDVDNLWHMFILYTKDYMKFGKEVFDHYLHHSPRGRGELKSEANPRQNHEEYKYFIELYESTFKEKVHPILLIDSYELMCEKRKQNI